jgi:hypothetical protein
VGLLKAEIEEAEGTLIHRQDLFELCAEAEKGSKTPLSDNFVISEACTKFALCVAAAPGDCGSLFEEANWRFYYFSQISSS